jgi:adenosylcobinamide kinase/adenosylcobinamide-phosphate guanylyltransferase
MLTDNQQGRLVLVLGGARAGKSTYALRLAQESNGSVCFIATAQAFDDDMSTRIDRHRKERPSHWQTIEEPYQINHALADASESAVVIVDCLTLFVSNWLLREDDENRCEQILREITADFLSTAQQQRQTIICVANEVGLGVVPETRLGRTFRDLLGRVNQDFAQAADEVSLLVAGIKMKLKP